MTSGVSIEAAKIAIDTTKQVITISSAIITISFAFMKDFLPFYLGRYRWIYLVPTFHFLSVFFGVWTLLAITGAVSTSDDGSVDLYLRSISLPMLGHLLFFTLGLGMIIFVLSKIKH